MSFSKPGALAGPSGPVQAKARIDRCAKQGSSRYGFCHHALYGHKQARLEQVMSDPSKAWDGELVRKWLERRLAASKLDQAAADRRGYEAQDDYDKAAAEEWVCRALQAADCANEQTAFAARLKELIGEEEYRATGVYDDVRFERHIRGQLRKLARMTKANEGFEKTLRYQ
jgi:hypothetical protein